MKVGRTRKKWQSEEVDQLRTMVADERTPPEIAEAIGRTIAAVETKMHTLGLKTNRPPADKQRHVAGHRAFVAGNMNAAALFRMRMRGEL